MCLGSLVSEELQDIHVSLTWKTARQPELQKRKGREKEKEVSEL